MDLSGSVSIALPVPHDATTRIANVLRGEGLLGELFAPLAVARFESPALRMLNHLPGMGQWRLGPGAVSCAPVQELLSAAYFRAWRGQRSNPLPNPVRWRTRSLDRNAARRLIAHRPAAVLVLQGRSPRVCAAALRLGIPIIYDANADNWEIENELRAMLATAAGPALRAELEMEGADYLGKRVPPGLAEAACVLAESQHMARKVRTVVRAATPVVVLGQGVDTSVFRPVPRDFSSKPIRVVHASRVAHAKGLAVANRAVAEAGPAVARYSVAGWGASAVPGLVQACADLTFVGGLSRDRLVGLLDAGDVFVLPTLADALPRAVLEAMACGLPVITTIGSGYEDIIRDGENGFLVRKHDHASIAELLVRLSGDGELRRRVGLAARATAEENSWERYEDRFRAELYNTIVPLLRR